MLKDAYAQKEAYGTALGYERGADAAAPQRETAMTSLVSQLRSLNDGLAKHRARLDMIVERVYGPRPQPAGTNEKGATRHPHALVDQITEALGAIESNSVAISELLSTLEGLA